MNSSMDAVVLDYQLPDLYGDEVLRTIRAMPGDNVPVVMARRRLPAVFNQRRYGFGGDRLR